MVIVIRSLIAAVALGLVAGPNPLAAQAIRGTVADSVGVAVEGAVVGLHSAEGAVRSVVTDPGGRFLLDAPAPGRYRLTVRRIGFGELRSDWLELAAEDTADVSITLTVDALELRGVEATVDAPAPEHPRLSSRGFYDRKDLYGTRSGFASFIDGEAMDRVNATRVSDALRLARGIQVRAAGGRQVTVRRTQRGCKMSLFIDGQRVRLYEGDEIDDFVSPREVIGIEVYTSVVPPRFSAPCGAVVVWTGMRE